MSDWDVNSHLDSKVRGSHWTKESRGRIYCFVKFPNKPGCEHARGSTRTMVHECVRRARTMAQLRMYRRLLLPGIIPPGIILETPLSLPLCLSPVHAWKLHGHRFSDWEKTSAVFLVARDAAGNLELPRRFTLRAPAILSRDRGTMRRLYPFFGGLGNG